MDEGFVDVFDSLKARDRELVAAMLQEEGIEARVAHEAVFVPDADEVVALQLVIAWQQRPHPPEFAAGAALLIFLVYLLGQAIGGFAIGLYLGASGGSLEEGGLVLALGVISGTLLGAYFAVRLTRRYLGGPLLERGAETLGLVRARWGDTLGGVGWGAMLGLLILGVQAVVAVPDDIEKGPFEQMASTPAGLVAMIVFAVLLAPPIEEFLFRGAMLHGLQRRWGRVPAALIVVVVFSAIHLPETHRYWPAIAAITLLGAITTGLRYESGSLLPPMAMHLAYNAVVSLPASLG